MESERYKIKVIGHTKVENHTEYIISIENKESSFSFSERYSNLKTLNDLMKKSTNNNAFPKFPPRKFFGTEDEKFINKRQEDINNYFEIISNNPQFISLPPLIQFIKEKKEKFGPSSSKKLTQIKPQAQPKKDLETSTQKELRKSIKKGEDDYNKIVNEFISRFYDMNTYYDIEMTNDSDSFVKYFENNKISTNSDATVESGNESNFSLICQNNNDLENIENKIREKIGKISDLYKSFDDSYNTKNIIVPI